MKSADIPDAFLELYGFNRAQSDAAERVVDALGAITVRDATLGIAIALGFCLAQAANPPEALDLVTEKLHLLQELDAQCRKGVAEA